MQRDGGPSKYCWGKEVQQHAANNFISFLSRGKIPPGLSTQQRKFLRDTPLSTTAQVDLAGSSFIRGNINNISQQAHVPDSCNAFHKFMYKKKQHGWAKKDSRVHQRCAYNVPSPAAAWQQSPSKSFNMQRQRKEKKFASDYRFCPNNNEGRCVIKGMPLECPIWWRRKHVFKFRETDVSVRTLRCWRRKNIAI